MARAGTTALGTLLLTTVALVAAGAVGVFAADLDHGPSPTAPHELAATANASAGTVTVVHESGAPLDVRELEVRVAVDGTLLRHQPAVPFLGSTGFRGAPQGPFNLAADPRWESGEAAGLTVAGTNAPPISPGSTVRIEVFRRGVRVAVVETVAR